MQDHLVLLNNYPFNRVIEVPTIGNAGGLAVLWDYSLLELSDIVTTAQEIHAMVNVRFLNDIWLFSSIYASTYRCKRKNLWQNLKNIKDNYFGKCLLGWDFNDLLHNSKKRGGKKLNHLCTADFLNMVNHYALIDMGFK